MTIWRISKEVYNTRAFAGDGGLYSPGRWHEKGVRVVYASSSISLATLEVWVHVELTQRLTSYMFCAAIVPDDMLISSVAIADLPHDWISKPLHPGVQAIGMNWLTSCESVVLRVPSVVSPRELTIC